MQGFFSSFKALVFGLLLTLPSIGWSNTVVETPGALAMTADALVVRPVMAVGTLLGGVIFVVSSPFAALGNNIDDSWDVLVKKPFEVTFDRCLGCTKTGGKEKVVNR